MKPILLAFFIVALVGCGEDEKQNTMPDVYRTIVIDGCQYLVAGHVPNNWHVITHKGNCNNPIHQPVKH